MNNFRRKKSKKGKKNQSPQRKTEARVQKEIATRNCGEQIEDSATRLNDDGGLKENGEI